MKDLINESFSNDDLSLYSESICFLDNLSFSFDFKTEID